MVISIWPSRPTTRERAPLTGRTEFPAIERRATTSKKFRMRTTGQVRGDLQRTCLIPAPSARTWIPPAALSSPTTEASATTASYPTQFAESFWTHTLAQATNVLLGSSNKAEFGESLVLVPDVYSFRSVKVRF